MAEIIFFGETTFRNFRRKFGIKLDDRRRHFYVVGKTGMGKTVMLKNMAVQDIQAGHGVGFVDPHGEGAEELLDFVPESRVQDVIYFDPGDIEYPIAFNVMEEVKPENRHIVVSGIMSVFKKIFGPEVWSARMEYILNYAVLALLEYPASTILGINRLLADPEYRKMVVDKVQDPVVKAFWLQEYARYTQRYEVEATAAIQNKVGQFISNPLLRNIIGQVRSAFDMREVMDGQKVFIANLSKGKIGEDASRLLGGLLSTKLQLAAMSRVEIPEEQRKDFFLYIDEFQNFASESFANILSEARKYRLALILGHQYIAQLVDGENTKMKDSVFGNVGTMVLFRVGAEDAEFLEKEFGPEFTALDLVNLGKYNIYVKLMIDGIASRPFSAITLPPFPKAEASFKPQIIEHSRKQYGSIRQDVEKKIAEWTEVQKLEAKSEGLAPLQSPIPSSQVLYDAVCSSCGKFTKVVFPPDGKRPVYCKPCRKKLVQRIPSTTLRAGAAKKAIQSSPASFPSTAAASPSPAVSSHPSFSLDTALKKGPTFFHPKQHVRGARSGRIGSQDFPPGAASQQVRPLAATLNRKERISPEQRKEELKQLLKAALQKAPQARDAVSGKQEKKRGVIQPGQAVYF